MEEFYFELLDNASLNWDKQNPKRIAIESYVQLLEHEGRLHAEFHCFLCSYPIKEEDISLIRAYLPTREKCTHALSIKKNSLHELFINKSSMFLTDLEVDILFNILLEGL